MESAVADLRLDLMEYNDAIRSIRNYFAIAALMRAAGHPAMARIVLESAATSLLNAETNAVMIHDMITTYGKI